MKIDVDIKARDTFGSLHGGDTFWYEPSGTVWMKLIVKYNSDDSDTIYNAVSLDDGTLSEFGDMERVTPIDAIVVNRERLEYDN